MATTRQKDLTITLAGQLPTVGNPAPDFRLVRQDLTETTLADYKGKIKVMLALPSLDTGVCARETKEFNQRMGGMPDVVVIAVSGDLPFAMKRYCAAEGVANVVTGSQYRDMNFSKKYGTHITNGTLVDLSARAVFVIDQNDVVAYVELVPEIGQEPDYETVTKAVQKLR